MEHPEVEEKQLAFVSVYEKLYDLLKDGTFPPKSALPSEPKLATMLGVSRMTLRQALSLLEEDGLIWKVRGKGNFVTDSNEVSVSGLEELGNPVYQSCILPIDNVEMDFRIEVPTEYELDQLQRRTAVSVAVDRWYRSGEKIVAYSLSLIPIETISQMGIDLNQKEQLRDMLEHGIYERAEKSLLKVQASNSGNFISSKYVVAENENIQLIQETLFCRDDLAPMLCNKHYIVPECFSLEIKRKR